VLMATHDYSILQKYPNRIVRVESNTVQDHQMS